MALPVTAGTPATAAQYNALVPTLLTQASDQALATTTYTDHNTFNTAALSFGAGQTWEIYVALAHLTADVGNDIKVRWETTGGTALVGYRHITGQGLVGGFGTTGWTGGGAGSSADVAGNFQARALTDSVSGGSTISATVLASWQERFIVSTSTAGTLGMEWAQASAVTGSTTVKAGSFLIARRLV